MLDCSKFKEVDIRVGKIVEVSEFLEGTYATHFLKIDFGTEIGIKTSIARLSPNYGAEVKGREIIGVVNLKPKQIGKYISEVLMLGVQDKQENLILIGPDKEVSLGGKVY